MWLYNRLVSLTLLLAIVATVVVDGFVPSAHQHRHHATDLTVIDPAMVAVAAASVSAGAAVQIPRLQNLRREVEQAKLALKKSEEEMIQKVADMEDKLFLMDQEFESETTEFQRNFDGRLRDLLETTKSKLKEDYQFALDIKLNEERSKMLQEKANFIGSVNGEKDVELVQLRLQRVQMNAAQKKMEAALAEAQREVEQLKATPKRRWLSFF